MTDPPKDTILDDTIIDLGKLRLAIAHQMAAGIHTMTLRELILFIRSVHREQKD